MKKETSITLSTVFYESFNNQFVFILQTCDDSLYKVIFQDLKNVSIALRFKSVQFCDSEPYFKVKRSEVLFKSQNQIVLFLKLEFDLHDLSTDKSATVSVNLIRLVLNNRQKIVSQCKGEFRLERITVDYTKNQIDNTKESTKESDTTIKSESESNLFSQIKPKKPTNSKVTYEIFDKNANFYELTEASSFISLQNLVQNEEELIKIVAANEMDVQMVLKDFKAAYLDIACFALKFVLDSDILEDSNLKETFSTLLQRRFSGLLCP